MDRFAAFFVVIGASLWGVDSIVLRPSLYSLPVALVVLIETGIVAIILTPFLFHKLKESRILKRRDWLAFLAVAFFGGALGTLAITKALFYVNYVNLSIVVLIQKLQPIFAILLAALFLREKPGKHFYVWGFVAILGAYLMTFGVKMPNFDTGNKTLFASLFALLAAFSFGASTVFSKRGLKNISFEVASYLRFILTFFMLIPLVLLLGDFSAVSSVNETQWGIFLIIAFTSGGPALFLYYYGLKRITASVSTIAELAFPLTAVVLEYFLHGHLLSLIQWVGVFILIYAIFQVTQVGKAALKDKTAESAK